MTLEEAIKHAEEVAATSCDEYREDHEQLATWLKELQDIKKNSIVITKTSLAWEVANLVISENKNLMNAFDEEEIMALGKHLLGYAETEQELEQAKAADKEVKR